MYLIYIDETGNTGLNLKDTQQPVFILCAMVLKEEHWFKMEKEYHSILNKHFSKALPEGFELHAIQLKNGTGAFKGMPMESRLALRNDMLGMIERFSIPFIYMRIIKRMFERFCAENYGPGIHVDPYIMALPFVCLEVDDFLRKKANNALGMFIFDEQKEYFLHVERSLHMLRLDKTSQLSTSNIIEKGFFVDSKKSFALQLGDLTAYYIRKYEENKRNRQADVFNN